MRIGPLLLDLFAMITYTLPKIIKDWQQEVISVRDQPLLLTIPANPDSLLDHPEVLQENHSQDYIPYWGYLWPAAKEMANLVAQADWPQGTRVLELGCGSGLIGLAALSRGMQVTFTDYRAEALQLAGYNAQRNQYIWFDTCQLDWLQPQELTAYPIAIASDVLYEKQFHEPLLNLLPRVVAPGGELWIGDPGRTLMLEFVKLARDQGWEPQLFDTHFRPCTFAVPGKFQLIVLKNQRD